MTNGEPSLPTEFTATALLGTLIWLAIRLALPRVAKVLDERTERLAALEASVQSLTSTVLELTASVARCEAERASLGKALEAARESKTRLLSKVDELEDELDALNAENRRLLTGRDGGSTT